MKKRALSDQQGALSSRQKAEILLRAALSKKATDPVLLRLRELTTLTDYFLIVSARSGRQVRAVAEAVVEDAEKHGIEKLSSEGVSRTHWALIDYGDVIVHIFHRPAREFYDLEGLWAEAPKEELTGDLAGEIQKAAQSNEADEWEEF